MAQVWWERERERGGGGGDILVASIFSTRCSVNGSTILGDG